MKITLNKALKLKNKLVKRVSMLGNRLQAVNSFCDTNPPAYNALDVLKEYQAAVDALVRLKVAINKANQGMMEQLVRIGEIKGMIAYINQVPVDAGEESRTRYGSEQAPEIWVATIGEIDRDKLSEQYQTELEAHQDSIDKYNATTEIEVD